MCGHVVHAVCVHTIKQLFDRHWEPSRLLCRVGRADACREEQRIVGPGLLDRYAAHGERGKPRRARDSPRDAPFKAARVRLRRSRGTVQGVRFPVPRGPDVLGTGGPGRDHVHMLRESGLVGGAAPVLHRGRIPLQGHPGRGRRTGVRGGAHALHRAGGVAGCRRLAGVLCDWRGGDGVPDDAEQVLLTDWGIGRLSQSEIGGMTR
mmetsp:Transcript_12807/g.36699  ORF Transcript_12807/g.36699 Transcript_12807/m.36699 type:complete len:206 (-) Transcript_12807:724-1341(-)